MFKLIFKYSEIELKLIDLNIKIESLQIKPFIYSKGSHIKISYIDISVIKVQINNKSIFVSIKIKLF